MPRGKNRVHPRIVERIIPDLAPEERARRIEHFYDVWAKVSEAKNYAGCKFDTETNTITRYWNCD